ncbi:MAG: phytanoyl-CoA dioxygenase family protein [Opitutaceae bacterium]|nr:phytanoyl-CoA dioxygenase family protein [Opitutaceae bacterium]
MVAPSPTANPRHRLTTAEVDTYNREGYHIFRDQLFPRAKFDGLKQSFEGILNNLDAEVRPESMDVPHFQHPQLFAWLFADEVLDLVEPIIGPDIALFSSHFICKPRGNGKRVPWHEDSHYWKTMITPMEVVTVWLAIDPSTKLNGCMNVVPLTHNTGKQGFSDYDDLKPGEAVFADEIKPAQRHAERAIAIELEAGQCSLHDGRIIHGSEPNTSDIRRCGYTMRYMSSKVKLNQEMAGSYHHIYLARGRDLGGNTYGDPTKAYPELARFRAKHGKNGH